MYEYQAVLKPTSSQPAGVVDGDTVYVNVDMGLTIYHTITLRLYGVNAPEMSTAAGKTAKQWVIDWFKTHVPFGVFTLQTRRDKTEKFGRFLATIVAPDGANLNEDLVASDNAVPYFP
jgi:endonuclease YncB( thermonuclease family)